MPSRNLVRALKSARCREGPAGAALPLVLHQRDCALRLPVLAVRRLNVRMAEALQDGGVAQSLQAVKELDSTMQDEQEAKN